jgi:hypothetical protein
LSVEEGIRLIISGGAVLTREQGELLGGACRAVGGAAFAAASPTTSAPGASDAPTAQVQS